MDIGKLRNKIIIQQKAVTRDTDGSEIEQWPEFATMFAEFVDQTGRVFFKAQQRFAEVEAVLRLRYIAGVNTKMRIQYGERIFDILGVEDVGEQHKELLVACKGVV